MNDEERILKEIKDVLKELDEQGRMKYTQKYMQHSDISVYKHCISVAYTSVELADRLAWNVNRRELIRGALLHDYFLYATVPRKITADSCRLFTGRKNLPPMALYSRMVTVRSIMKTSEKIFI